MSALIETPPDKETEETASPARFQTARSTLFIDGFMTYFIKAGGIGIIAAVLGIFVFMGAQIVPLFKGAEVTEKETVQLPAGDYVILGVDEWGELPFVVDQKGVIRFAEAKTGRIVHSFDPTAEFNKAITAFRFNHRTQELVYGTADGSFVSFQILYKPNYEEAKRKIISEIEKTEPVQIAPAGSRILKISSGGDEDRKIVSAIVEAGGVRKLYAAVLEAQTSLMGGGTLELLETLDLSELVKGKPKDVLVNSQGDGIVVSTEDGKINYLAQYGEEFELVQVFGPFVDLEDTRIASIDYLFGEVSLVLTNPAGVNRIFSLLIPRGELRRLYVQTKEFKALPAGAEFFDASLRNKAFLIGTGGFVSLRYATTEDIRWEKELPFTVSQAAVGGKYDSLFLLDTESKLHLYDLDDHHPEAGLKAFFGKIWYEGYTAPSYEWQSTSGTDDFEPKLSLVPLIIGTLKGTFYAMIFALPIAILAAIYTSQFAHPKFKIYIKPCMEVMASLPSVVLGFLAALWLAPILETRVPSLIMIFLLAPLASLCFGAFWSSLHLKYRGWIRPGHEWLVAIPILLLACYAGWQLGPVIEKLLFVVKDPDTGIKVADFRLWWPDVTGTPYEQRNSLVVGFMMGSAVIPIIFTISEDSLSNVPKTLSSGSLALGASRWQTAMRVIVPTAYPGIFSAVMIGLGRAIGETMIVVMATGNTPVMDFNIFSGMRTLSANIAVELPEAPYLGTLYRALFLGAMVLFMMTFIMNTAAEIIRQRLREKYKTV